MNKRCTVQVLFISHYRVHACVYMEYMDQVEEHSTKSLGVFSFIIMVVDLALVYI